MTSVFCISTASVISNSNRCAGNCDEASALSTVGKSSRQQMMEIANSGWASSHYGNGANLIATYDELSDLKVATA